MVGRIGFGGLARLQYWPSEDQPDADGFGKWSAGGHGIRSTEACGWGLRYAPSGDILLRLGVGRSCRGPDVRGCVTWRRSAEGVDRAVVAIGRSCQDLRLRPLFSRPEPSRTLSCQRLDYQLQWQLSTGADCGLRRELCSMPIGGSAAEDVVVHEWIAGGAMTRFSRLLALTSGFPERTSIGVATTGVGYHLMSPDANLMGRTNPDCGSSGPSSPPRAGGRVIFLQGPHL